MDEWGRRTPSRAWRTMSGLMQQENAALSERVTDRQACRV
ncbi:MbeD/MobD family mobilization/exclusion protein [Pantoea stewartii]